VLSEVFNVTNSVNEPVVTIDDAYSVNGADNTGKTAAERTISVDCEEEFSFQHCDCQGMYDSDVIVTCVVCEREFHARCLGFCGDDLLDIIDENVQEMTCHDCTELLSGEFDGDGRAGDSGSDGEENEEIDDQDCDAASDEEGDDAIIS
jgi:hypothetical protein